MRRKSALPCKQFWSAYSRSTVFGDVRWWCSSFCCLGNPSSPSEAISLSRLWTGGSKKLGSGTRKGSRRLSRNWMPFCGRRGERQAPPPRPRETAAPAKPSRPSSPRPLESFKPKIAAGPAFQDMPGTAQNLSATLAIPPAIKNHVRNLPQGVFNNMDLEVEEVKFHGDTAEAYVRFQSPNVTELVIRQRYVLRKSGDQWQVESRQPANGAGKAPPQPLPTGQAPMRLI